MRTSRRTTLAAFAAAAAIAGAGAFAWSQSGPGTERMQPGPKYGQCRAVLANFELMGREVMDLDESLETRLDLMRSADEQGRLDAMAAVIEQIASQRSIMRETLKRTHQALAMHLIEHQVAAASHEDFRRSLAECPMIRYLRRDTVPKGPGRGTPDPLDR